MHLLSHSAKFETLPSARSVALGKEPNFAECQCGSTRQSSKLRRVLPAWHSAKFESLPSATRLALGKVFDPVPFGRPVRPVCPFRSPVCCCPSRFNFFLLSAAWHTAKVYRVPEKRHSAKPASPVEERPCALRRVLHSAKKLPSVFRPLPSVCDTRQSTRVR